MNLLESYKSIMKKCFLFLVFYSVCYFLAGQKDTTTLIKYTPDFKFNEGIYLNFEQFRSNQPIPKSFIITNKSMDDIDFFDAVFEEEKIIVYDKNGMKNEINTDKIWGYCNLGIVFIQYNNEFNRIPVIGSISHFVSNFTSTQYRRNDPFNSYYNPYAYDPLMRNQTYTTKELRQYILDVETGKVIDYTYENLMVILMRDAELYEEFNNLKRRQKKKMVFFFLRKYNERNPLFIKVNSK